LSTSDLLKKVTSPEKSLVLPPTIHSDKYEASYVKLKMAHLNGVCANDIKFLINAAYKLGEDVNQLKRQP
jgi:hypothetical protein